MKNIKSELTDVFRGSRRKLPEIDEPGGTYNAYMPYLCNLDYVMFGVLGAPLFREHTCFEDGDYCDFKLKNDAETLPYWPPVFSQDNPYK